jgi:hypothetical protein
VFRGTNKFTLTELVAQSNEMLDGEIKGKWNGILKGLKDAFDKKVEIAGGVKKAEITDGVNSDRNKDKGKGEENIGDLSAVSKYENMKVVDFSYITVKSRRDKGCGDESKEEDKDKSELELELESKKLVETDKSELESKKLVEKDKSELELELESKKLVEKEPKKLVEKEPTRTELELESKKLVEKEPTRTRYTSFSKTPLLVSFTKDNYIISHYTPADLCMLDDFFKGFTGDGEGFSKELKIVNKSFVSGGNSIKINGCNVKIRDSILLTAAKTSLAKVGDIYGVPKVEINEDKYEKMDVFLAENREEFIKYAMTDAFISLIHGLHMEEFNHSLGNVGIPLTMSVLSESYVKSK